MKRNTILVLLAFAGFLTLTAAGASRFINGTEIPQAVTLLYSTGAQAASLGATTVTSLTASGNAGIAGTLGVTGAATLAGAVSWTNVGSVAATGPTGASATALAYQINGITAATGGLSVVLPTAVTGRTILIGNTSAVSVSVYPYTGDAINAGSANDAITVSTGKSYFCGATGADNWVCAGN